MKRTADVIQTGSRYERPGALDRVAVRTIEPI